MLFFLLLLVLIIIYKAKFHFKDFNKNYISIEQTKCINAIFVILVFLSHSKSYLNLDNLWYNSYYLKINNMIGQLMVTTFLFFSGFGIMESIKSKKQNYINSIPKKRFLNTLLNFDLAVLLFLICNLFVGNHCSLKNILLSFTGWSSIGNSNWYIFDILILYLLTWVSFKVFDKNNLKAIISTTLLSLFLMCFLMKTKPLYWYDTVLCYPAGMLFSYCKNKLENLICENNKTYLFISFICIISFILLYKISKTSNVLVYQLTSILFVILILLVCMKFSFKNRILNYLGNNIFWIYVLQRIPMIILKHYNINSYNPYLFVIISFISTIILTETVKLFIKLLKSSNNKIKNLIYSKSEL